jgi:hypothetical protein
MVTIKGHWTRPQRMLCVSDTHTLAHTLCGPDSLQCSWWPFKKMVCPSSQWKWCVVVERHTHTHARTHTHTHTPRLDPVSGRKTQWPPSGYSSDKRRTLCSQTACHTSAGFVASRPCGASMSLSGPARGRGRTTYPPQLSSGTCPYDTGMFPQPLCPITDRTPGNHNQHYSYCYNGWCCCLPQSEWLATFIAYQQLQSQWTVYCSDAYCCSLVAPFWDLVVPNNKPICW